MYTPRNILLTGGAGFIGSHVAETLTSKYPFYKVVVLDKMDYCASTQNLSKCLQLPNFKLVHGDIQSMDLLTYLLSSEQIDTVVHFAAQTHVDNSFGNSVEFTMNNTLGTHVLLEASRQAGTIKRFVNVSTDEVYGDTSVDAAVGLAEASPLEPTNPYSAAKAGAEMLCKAYMTSYSMPIIITRGNNVYGPRQYPEKLVPKFIILATRGLGLPVHGDGSSVRSYLYIDDVVDAFDRIIHYGRIGETYNIGTDSERTVANVANDILCLVESNESKIDYVKDRAFNDRRYYIGSKKLCEELGWSQRVKWEDGLAATAKWYMRLLHQNELDSYWPDGDIGKALQAHPHRTS